MENQHERNAVFSGHSSHAMADMDTPLSQQPFHPSAAVPRVDIVAEEFNYTVPVESVPLPSSGLVYPQGSVLHGRDSLEIRSMTAKEEDILTSRALIKNGTVISRLLQSCITTPGVNPDLMLSGDRNAVMIALRITGYGSAYAVEVQCPNCGEKSKQDFDLSELNVKRLEINPTSVGQNEFEFILPVSKKKVKFKFMTGRDEQEILKIQERLKKSGQQGDRFVTQKLQYSIISVNGITDPSKLQMFIQNMPAGDSRALRKYIDDNEPGVDMTSYMTCPSCSESSEVKLPMGASFFWPDA